MAGWDGFGNFVRNYNWTTDAANGIKILASKMDTEFNTYATGLMNCLTRDNQTKPSADTNWNAKKITNLAPGVATTDAATVGQIVGNAWVNETNGFAWLSATQIDVTAIDVTATYHVGRRVAFKDNGVQRYATVTASTFGVNTTLTLVVDGGAALTGPTTLLQYGLLPYVNRSYFDPRTIVRATLSATQNIVGTGTTQVLFDTAGIDALSEFGSNRVTVKYPGYYDISAILEMNQSSSPGSGIASIYVNGASIQRVLIGQQASSLLGGISIATVALLAAGATIDIRASFGASGGTIGGGTTILSSFSVVRIL